MVNLEYNLIPGAAVPRPVRFQFAPDHQGDQLIPVCLRSIDGRHILPVTHNRNAVRNGEKLFHSMGNENNGCSFFLQGRDNPVEILNLSHRQLCRRLIHDDDLRIF